MRKDFTNVQETYHMVSKHLNEQDQKFANTFKSDILHHITREKKSFPHLQRSKFIVDPLRTYMVDIHRVTSYRGGIDFVPPDIALNIHYRDWEDGGTSKEARTIDTTVVNKYGHELVGRLYETWAQL